MKTDKIINKEKLTAIYFPKMNYLTYLPGNFGSPTALNASFALYTLSWEMAMVLHLP